MSLPSKTVYVNEKVNLPTNLQSKLLVYIGCEIFFYNVVEHVTNNGYFIFQVNSREFINTLVDFNFALIYESLNFFKTADGSRYSVSNYMCCKPPIPVPICTKFLNVRACFGSTDNEQIWVKHWFSDLKGSEIEKLKMLGATLP